MNLPSETRLSWAVTALAGGYVVWTAYVLSLRVPAFGAIFSGLGAELPWPTRAVLTICTPAILWPVAIAVLVLLVVKEVRCRLVRTRVILSTLIFMATVCVSSLVTEALFRPMLALIEQIQ